MWGIFMSALVFILRAISRFSILRIFILSISFFTFTGCASYFLKKECEKVDWHKHGYDLAMQGKRVTGDKRVTECRGVERISDSQLDLGFKSGMSTYCKPESVYSTGRSGEFFNTELCDPGIMGTLKSRHAQGVREYCAVSNGFKAGARGKAYNNICPSNMVDAFLKEFNKGRKKYLETMVTENQTRIHMLDKKVIDLEKERINMNYQLMALPQPQRVQKPVHNLATGKQEVQWTTEDRHYSQRSNLENQMRSKDLEISTSRKEQETLQNQIHEFQRELATFQN